MLGCLVNVCGSLQRARPPFWKGGDRRRRSGDYFSILNLVVLLKKSPFNSPFFKGDEDITTIFRVNKHVIIKWPY